MPSGRPASSIPIPMGICSRKITSSRECREYLRQETFKTGATARQSPPPAPAAWRPWKQRSFWKKREDEEAFRFRPSAIGSRLKQDQNRDVCNTFKLQHVCADRRAPWNNPERRKAPARFPARETGVEGLS